jgi:alkanesulfonate monooxygenase SsuD/methylene tetrahydromethanopterin reductase-like flavin-dependent oxidoreductase (luciferase family)
MNCKQAEPGVATGRSAQEEWSMKFGIFDHMDDAGAPVGAQYEDRLQLIEEYDRAGFYAYHLAEHHGTPLGYAPSPSVFLAAVAQRTKKLRFGPLVYVLPLYHPLRLIEEICMLDQMSCGRLELGVGRGASPIEVGFFGPNLVNGPKQFAEALEVIKKGLTSEILNHQGDFYQFDGVPLILKPVQQPHPPLWYGVMSPETTVWTATDSANIVTLRPTCEARAITDQYRVEWQRLGKPVSNLPLLGVSRQIVLAESENEARCAAQRAYRPWRKHLELLWKQYGVPFRLTMFPHDFDELQSAEGAFAGTAAGARAYIERQTEMSGANYFVCDISFGDLSVEEVMRTVELLAREVMPAFPDRAGLASVD